MMDEAKDAIRRRLAEVKTFLARESPPRLSESDTKANFIEPIIAALGWQGIGVVTREYYVRNSQEFIDCVMAGPTGPLLAIEAKPLQTDLTDKHAAQLIQYCAVEGIEWAALTNGRELQFFNSFLRPDLAAKRVLRLDLLAFNSEAEFEALFDQIWQLSRESMTKPSGVRTWLNQRRLDTALRAILLDSSSSTIRQLRKLLADAEISATTQDLAQWFRIHLGAAVPTIGMPKPGEARNGAPAPAPEAIDQTSVEPTARRRRPARAPEVAGQRHILTPLSDDDTGTATEKLRRLLGAGWYVFGEHTPTRKVLAEGDRLCFYVAKVGVVAEALVASAPERRSLPEVTDPERFPWAFRVREVRFFEEAPVVLDAGLRAHLDALRNREPGRSWSWFVQGTHTVTPHDFALLTGRDPGEQGGTSAQA